MSKPSKIKRRNKCNSMLSKELSEQYKTKLMGIRKGDTVSIMRGNFRDVEGKVVKVDRKKNFIYIEGVTREKANKDVIFVPIRPSKVMIKKLNLEDKRRKDILDRKATITIPEVSLKQGLGEGEEKKLQKHSIKSGSKR